MESTLPIMDSPLLKLIYASFFLVPLLLYVAIQYRIPNRMKKSMVCWSMMKTRSTPWVSSASLLSAPLSEYPAGTETETGNNVAG